MIQKYIIPIVITIFVAASGISAWLIIRDTSQNSTLLAPSGGIDSYEECAAAGYPILESYPEQCLTPDGRGFVRELTDAERKRLEEDTASSNPELYLEGGGASSTYVSEYPDELVYSMNGEASLNTVLSNLGGGAAFDPIDFSQKLAILVMTTSKPSLGYSLHVDSISEKNGTLLISATESTPGTGCVTASTISKPFQIVTIDKLDYDTLAYTIKLKTKDCS